MQGNNARHTAEAVEEMARVTGLKVDRDRARRLRDELEGALAAVNALDAAIPAGSPGTAGAGEFDPGWSDAREGRRA
jgi:hypothetical protein